MHTGFGWGGTPCRLFAVCTSALLALGHAHPHTLAAAPDNPPTATPVPPTTTDLAPALAELVAKHKAPALAAAVVKGGRITAHGVSGVRARDLTKGGDEPSAAATLDDRWHIGSCTKAMTATLCARLVERGMLSWDRTLAEAFPDEAANMHEAYRAVTLRQLLTQRSGIGGAPVGDLWIKLWAHKGETSEGRRLALRMITSAPPAYEPGQGHEYSNFNFMIAGLMAERAAGAPWEKLMQEEVFTPLGMTSAGFGPPTAPGSRDAGALDNVRGHVSKSGRSMKPGPQADNPPSLGPAGTVHCTIDDLARFAAVHLKGARGEPTGYLKPETFTLLHSAPPPPPNSNYAFGWVVREQKAYGGITIWHNGSNTMWYAEMLIVPGKNVAVAVACNAADADSQKAVKEAVKMLAAQPAP